MGALLKFEVQAVWETCCLCHVQFAITSDHHDRLVKEKQQFFCPNGHPQSYTGKSDAFKLREAELALANEQRLRFEAEGQKANAIRDRKNAETQATKAKNKLARMTKRVEAGVCPHCNRTFKQLAAHMKCKHAADQAVANLT